MICGGAPCIPFGMRTCDCGLPRPRPNPPTLQHSNPPTLQHSNTPTLQHSNTPTLQHSNTPTLQHSNTPTLQHSNTPTLQHPNTPILKYSVGFVALLPSCCRKKRSQLSHQPLGFLFWDIVATGEHKAESIRCDRQ